MQENKYGSESIDHQVYSQMSHLLARQNEWKLLIVRSVERNGTANAVLQPCLSAFQRQRLIVNGKLVDEKLVSQNKVRQISDANNTHSTLPHAMTWDYRIPLGIDRKKWFCVWQTCFREIHSQNLYIIIC